MKRAKLSVEIPFRTLRDTNYKPGYQLVAVIFQMLFEEFIVSFLRPPRDLRGMIPGNNFEMLITGCISISFQTTADFRVSYPKEPGIKAENGCVACRLLIHYVTIA